MRMFPGIKVTQWGGDHCELVYVLSALAVSRNATHCSDRDMASLLQPVGFQPTGEELRLGFDHWLEGGGGLDARSRCNHAFAAS